MRRLNRPPRHRHVRKLSLLVCVGVALRTWAAEPAAPPAPPARAAELPAFPPMMCPEELMFGDPLPARSLRPALQLGQGIEVLSDGLRVEADGAAQVQGNVELRQGDRSVRANEVQLNPNDRSVSVSGDVEYRDPELRVRGESGDFADGAAQFRGAEFEMPLQPARGSADLLSLSAAGVMRLEGVRYTTCPPGREHWGIRASSVSLDTKQRMGTARGATLDFMGVPVLKLPTISFPIGDARKSGFLFPSIGSTTRGGLQLTVPYYFNLAPNRDATLATTVYARRGINLGGEFRYLTQNSRGQLDGDLLPDDRVYNATRSRIRFENVTSLPLDWRLTIDAEDVSDAQYFEDFSQGIDGASIAFLPRLLHLSYRDPNWRLGLLARNFQTIDQELLPEDRPYTELPRLYAEGRWRLPGVLPLEYGFTSEASGFERNVGVQGYRVDVAPQVALRYEGAGYFVRPAVAFEATQYRLTDTAPGQDRSPLRTLPLASVDAGLLFERATGSAGIRRVTLEPRLMYLYVPYRDQDQLPVFDTGEPDLNWVQLFRTNRYVGLDRIGDANQVSVGLTSQLFSSQSGTRFLAATLGQTFYFDAPRVRLPDEPPRDDDASDLIAQLELQAFRNWSADLGLQWNYGESEVERSEVRLQYRPDPGQVINAGYRFQRDRLEQADVSAAWPLSDSWKFYGRLLYSLRDDQVIESFAGFEYGSCCWGLRVVARDYVSRRSGERDRGIYLQLELRGLSSVGMSANSFLERSIRGYSSNRRPQ
jgi:LPS-assembly protein